MFLPLTWVYTKEKSKVLSNYCVCPAKCTLLSSPISKDSSTTTNVPWETLGLWAITQGHSSWSREEWGKICHYFWKNTFYVPIFIQSSNEYFLSAWLMPDTILGTEWIEWRGNSYHQGALGSDQPCRGKERQVWCYRIDVSNSGERSAPEIETCRIEMRVSSPGAVEDQQCVSLRSPKN